MKPSAYAGPMVSRALAQQALATRIARRAERAAIALAGGGDFLLARGRAAPGAKRARATFGLASGELCSCGGATCPTCGSDDAQDEPACPCGRKGCRVCSAPLTGLAGVAFPGWSAPVAYSFAPPVYGGPSFSPTGAIVVPPTVPWIDIHTSEPITVSGTVGHDGWIEPTVVCDGEYFDMHSHSFCGTNADWSLAESGAAGTNAEERADWLYRLHAYGVGCMVIAGMIDDKAGTDAITDLDIVNDVTLFVAALYPTYFAPFLQVFPKGGAFASDAAEYVEARLAEGFQGVGELFIHGHDGNVNDLEPLASICRVAASYGVPVQCHWEYGNVDDTTVRTAEENFAQLIQLLDMFPNSSIIGYTTYDDNQPVPLKFVSCHCGAGPGDMIAGTRTFGEYKARVERLLAHYPNVFFDIAGMQIGANQQLYFLEGRVPVLTALGAFLLEKMAMYPTRFLVGTDTENRTSSMTDDYCRSVVNYGIFLGLGSLSPDEQVLIKSGNAFVVLYARANLVTVSASSYIESRTASWP